MRYHWPPLKTRLGQQSWVIESNRWKKWRELAWIIPFNIKKTTNVSEFFRLHNGCLGKDWPIVIVQCLEELCPSYKTAMESTEGVMPERIAYKAYQTSNKKVSYWGIVFRLFYHSLTVINTEKNPNIPMQAAEQETENFKTMRQSGL